MLGFSRETEPTEYIEICKRGFIVRIGSRPLEDEKSYSPQARGQGRLTAQLCLSPLAFEDGGGADGKSPSLLESSGTNILSI